MSEGDSPCELAALVSSNPPAPAAPSRNISLRFNDIFALSGEALLIQARRLIADNQKHLYPRFNPRTPRFVAITPFFQCLEMLEHHC
jgi:hypothetical protein